MAGQRSSLPQLSPQRSRLETLTPWWPRPSCPPPPAGQTTRQTRTTTTWTACAGGRPHRSQPGGSPWQLWTSTPCHRLLLAIHMQSGGGPRAAQGKTAGEGGGLPARRIVRGCLGRLVAFPASTLVVLAACAHADGSVAICILYHRCIWCSH